MLRLVVNVMNRDLNLRAASDLMISRLRRLFGLPYLGSDNTPPAFLNDAFMFNGSDWVNAVFADSEITNYPHVYRVGDLSIGVSSLHKSSLEDVIREIDQAAIDFTSVVSPVSHVSRLVLKFDFGSSDHVDRDIRQVFFAPIFDRFDGRLTYTPSTSYPMKVDVGDWNRHPDGIDLAWEGEYVFKNAVLVSDLADVVSDAYKTELRLDWPTRLSEQTIEGIRCLFSLTARFF